MASTVVKEEPLDVKRLNLALPTNLYTQIEKYAKDNEATITEAIRRFLKMGLFMETNTIYTRETYNEEVSYQEILFF